MAALTPLTKNNLLIYYGPAASVGGPNTIDAAIRFFSRFAVVVLGVQAGGDLANAQRIIQECRRINPAWKWAGYTSLGGSASYGTWSTDMAAWATNFPAPFTPDLLFIDQFGQDWTLSTRANQNQAITDTHTAGYGAFVNGFDLVTVFGQNPGEAAPNIGTHATITDYFLLESYYVSVLDGATLEETNHRLYRAQQAQEAQNRLKVIAAAVLGAGTSLVVPYATWDLVRRELATYGIGLLAVGPSDYGSSSHTAFYYNEANNTVYP